MSTSLIRLMTFTIVHEPASMAPLVMLVTQQNPLIYFLFLFWSQKVESPPGCVCIVRHVGNSLSVAMQLSWLFVNYLFFLESSQVLVSLLKFIFKPQNAFAQLFFLIITSWNLTWKALPWVALIATCS